MMTEAAQTHELPPPAVRVGAIGWLRTNLFSSPANAILTVVLAYLLIRFIPPVLDWAFFSANFIGDTRAACTQPGACWTLINARFWQFMYGFYPDAERWRVNLSFLLLFGAMIPALIDRMPFRRYFVLFLFLVYPFVGFWLFSGGFGLEIVETRYWGGLMLTLVIGVCIITASVPLGALLALGRRSDLPLIRLLCVGFIETVRGVPLITVLFMSSVMLPLFLPDGVSIDKLLRAMVAFTCFAAAYMAEAIRGGLQAIPRGQFEAAKALGLTYWKMTGLIILPQALRIAIPALVNNFIGLFKDTTLVVAIGLYDFLNIVQISTRDGQWIGLGHEAYVFAAAFYFVLCFAMSRYSLYLERKLAIGRR